MVISPLLALQQDQIAALNERDDPSFAAVRISSAETPTQQREAIHEIRDGRAEFLFVTPEQLSDPDRLAEVRAAAARAWSQSTRRTASRPGATTSGPTTSHSVT